jgi:phage tail protein X
MTSFETLTVQHEDTLLDLLIWRRFLRPMPGLVEDTFARNPGLGGLGPVLPVGTEVVIAIPLPVEQRPAVEVVSLWD